MQKKDLLHIHPKRILVCQLRQIGDVVLTTHIPEMLKKKYPDAEIDFFTEKKCAPVLEHNPFVSEIKILDKADLTHFGKEIRAYWRIARNSYDLVIDFQQLPRCRFVVLFSRAPVRFTSTPPWYNRWLYTHFTEPAKTHAIIRKAKMLAPLGIEWAGEMPNFHLTQEEKNEAQSLLIAHGVNQPENILVSVAPTHHSPTRKWPASHYGQLINLAVTHNKRIKFFLFHGPGERECAEEVLKVANCPENCILPESMLSIRQMAAVIEKADIHIGNCSAPRHCAVAVGTPSLTIIGSAGSGWTFPKPEHIDISKNLPCQPCKRNTCALQSVPCLATLQPEAVYGTLIEHIEKFAHH
jgi:ADP-heptose:LPS heptosyltransferase